ncbi:MAG TPA: diguanylate cyclase [Gemmatimonadaceae bacterium]|nr:diguanylate cyclase [Gemmatimonadaceae bacterium]
MAFAAVENVTQYMRVPRLHSIRARILALAVLGTLFPAGIALGVAYSQNRRAREEKVTQELVSQSSQTARAMGAWLKERVLDLRVFASSDEVSNSLGKSSNPVLANRLREYLRSLHERFTDFDQLLVLDSQGHVLATSAAEARQVDLPADWQKTLRQQNQLIGKAYWDTSRAGRSAKSGGRLMLAVPVIRADGRPLGAFAAELSLTPVQAQLREYSPDTTSMIYLAGLDGALIASSKGVSRAMLRTTLDGRVLEELTRHDNKAASYESVAGVDVVGTMKRVPQIPWMVVAEMPSAATFRAVRHFRNVALMVVVALLVVVGASAYWLGLKIVRPLESLAKGAAEVSLGDLNVDLPSTGDGEVAVLTGVFNGMVKRLREGREELERLSVTDGLTGLSNHRSLRQRLHEEVVRSTRNKHEFSVIMVDVDHFKSYNDAFGHPAGDAVLKRVATLLKDSARAVDCVGRYGGEEFAALLPETDSAGALEVAERMRSRVEAERFPERHVTVSIGVATFPENADQADTIVSVADAALYEAKRSGRNRVVSAAKPQKPARPKAESRKTTEQRVLPAARRPTRAKKKS